MRATAHEKSYLGAIAALPCVVCGAGRVTVHHLRHNPNTGQSLGKSQRSPHHHVVPLCDRHHQSGGFGVAYHAGSRTWEANYGREIDLWEQLQAWLQNSDLPYPHGEQTCPKT